MDKIFNFMINNQSWQIKEITQEEMREELKKHNDRIDEFGKYYGLTYADIQTIFIDKDLCVDRKRTTLLHELAHCYILAYITHLDRNYSEEDVADIIANSHDIISKILSNYYKDKGIYIN